MTGVWATNDVISSARMNEKTVFQGTGAAISGLAATYSGMLAFCTSSGSGFTADVLYQRNTANTAWSAVGTHQLPYLKLSTTIGDYSQPTTATATSAGTVTADITDNCSSDNFTDNDSGVMGVSGGSLTWNFVRDGTVNTTVRDCTSMSDTAFLFRCKLVVSTVTTGTETHYGFIGLTTLDQTSHMDSAGDSIGIVLVNTSGGTKEFRAIGCNGDDAFTPTVTSTFATALAAGTYYLEIKRTSATEAKVGLYSDSAFTTLTEEETLTITSGYTGLRYISFQNWNQVAGTGVLNGTADDFSLWKNTSATTYTATNAVDGGTTTYWQSSSEANPAIYVDLGSAREIVGVALNINKTTTTVTSLKIRASTDTSFADAENIAYVNISDFTDDTWRFLANNFLETNTRYVQIYANETGVLAINEIKVRYGVTDLLKILNHRHGTRTTGSADSFTDSN